ncbi:uncharacterized protein TrAtP1_008762 [Trichoderma atroviride]|uniref:uncharacterized protein n=1 Tax=Hypocrea atroviridis TaxID=63577 RepID=UPI00332ACD55|nr:hypothetical protein TrAtP1_008762 [Trichoderma atroviride]
MEAKCNQERNKERWNRGRKSSRNKETLKPLPDIREAPSSSLPLAAPGSALLPANSALDMMSNFHDEDAVDEL